MAEKKTMTLEQVVETCIAANPVLTKLAFDKLAAKFNMGIDEFLNASAKAYVLSNIFGESSIGLLLPQLESMQSGIYTLDDYAKDTFEELYYEIFEEKVEIEN